MDRLNRMDAGAATESGPAPGGADANGAGENPVTSAFHDLLSGIGELKEYASFYLSAKVDAVKFSLIKTGIIAALGVIGLFALIAITVTASILLLGGLSEGVGRLVGAQWLGNLIIGALFLVGIGLGGFVGLGVWKKRFHSSLVKKYELRKLRQRERWGRDVEERSNASTRAE